jgi:hypothetical protein
MMKTKKMLSITTTALLILLYSTLAAAQDDGFNVPLGAESVTVERSETSNASLYDPDSVEAIAGNLTELSITGVSQTKSWQGFFGNITGTIILEDASGNRFYDWSAAEPQGQVYASVNNTITWTDIGCAPIDDSGYRSSWYTFYGMDENDYDNINVTYSLDNHPTFYVGFEEITGCRTTYTFVNNVSQGSDFPAVLLASDSNSTLIFTAIIEDKTPGVRGSVTGYDGSEYDFQLLVAEDGTNGNDQTTTYYFWLEIQ